MPDSLCNVSGRGVGNTASCAKWKTEKLQHGFSGCLGKGLLLQGRSSLARRWVLLTGAERGLPPPVFQSLEHPLVAEPFRVSGQGEKWFCRVLPGHTEP